MPEDAAFFIRALQDDTVFEAIKREIPAPVHPLIIFGPPGVGKAELAHTVARQAGAMVYEIDLEMAPLKIQVEVVLKALSDFSDLELASSRKIFFS